MTYSRKRIATQTASVLKSLFIVFFFLPFALQGQEETNTTLPLDTVYVLFERTGNKIIEVGTAVYYKPELGYPQDVVRNHFVVKHLHCYDCKRPGPDEKDFNFSYRPWDKKVHYKLVPMKGFLKKDYKDQDWFNETSIEDINKFFKNKVIYLVDEGYLSDGKVFMLRVTLEDYVVE